MRIIRVFCSSALRNRSAVFQGVFNSCFVHLNSSCRQEAGTESVATDEEEILPNLEWRGRDRNTGKFLHLTLTMVSRIRVHSILRSSGLLVIVNVHFSSVDRTGPIEGGCFCCVRQTNSLLLNISCDAHSSEWNVHGNPGGESRCRPRLPYSRLTRSLSDRLLRTLEMTDFRQFEQNWEIFEELFLLRHQWTTFSQKIYKRGFYCRKNAPGLKRADDHQLRGSVMRLRVSELSIRPISDCSNRNKSRGRRSEHQCVDSYHNRNKWLNEILKANDCGPCPSCITTLK